MDLRKWLGFATGVAPTPPVAPSIGFPTDGNPLAPLPATEPGAYWFYQLSEEWRNIILAGGITPDSNTLTQGLDAIIALIRARGNKVVRVASTAPTNLAAPGANIDGTAMVLGDAFLEKDHATQNLRGIYIWNGAAVAASRALWADEGVELFSGLTIHVEQGTANADSNWQLTTDGAIVVGTTALTFILDATGLTQAQADLRYQNIGYMLVRDEKAQNTAGGTSVTGTQTRVLNTVLANTISGASLAANQITLPAGTYRVIGFAPAIVNAHRAYLYNETDLATVVLGSSEQASPAADSITTSSIILGRFAIGTTKNFSIRHFTLSGVATFGLGFQANDNGNEVYTQLEIIKES